MSKISNFKKFFEQAKLQYSVFKCDADLKEKYDSDDINEIIRISGTDFCFDYNDNLLFSKENQVNESTMANEHEKFKLISDIAIEKKIGKSRPIISSECKYIDDSRLPVLVLATKVWYPFKNMSSWTAIRHECAGIACEHFEFMGMVLNARESTRLGMKSIEQRWLDSNCGALVSSMDDVSEYRDQLIETLGVDCNYSFSDLKEGVYPIDASHENLSRLASDDLPQDLDDLIEWDHKFSRMCGVINRWNLYIIGQNSD